MKDDYGIFSKYGLLPKVNDPPKGGHMHSSLVTS